MRRFWIAVVVVALVGIVCDGLVNGLILKDIYAGTASLWREPSEMQQLAWLGILGYLFFAWVFMVIFRKGYEKEKPGLGQGVRYGFWIGLLVIPVICSVFYMLIPIPVALAAGWFIGGMVEFLAIGTVAGMIYKP